MSGYSLIVCRFSKIVYEKNQLIKQWFWEDLRITFGVNIQDNKPLKL